MPELEPEGDIAATGAGAATDLAASGAPFLEKTVEGTESTAAGASGKPRSLWSDAWHDLRRNPVFIASGLIILFLVLVSLWPSAITWTSPLKCDLAKAQEGSQPGHPFGYDGQGCDVYTRTVYGARTSVTVGGLATLGVALFGSVLGGWQASSAEAGTRSCPGSPTSSSPSRSSSAAWSSSPW